MIPSALFSPVLSNKPNRLELSLCTSINCQLLLQEHFCHSACGIKITFAKNVEYWNGVLYKFKVSYTK